MPSTIDEGKLRAQRTWGDSPAGTTFAGGARPGTREFFERASRTRAEYEQPWLPSVFPFNEMRDKRVLEIGFGAGFDAHTLLLSGANYSGIDITPENIVCAKDHLRFYGYDPDVRQGDAEALDFPDATFDVVYSNGVLHHVPNIGRAFSEVYRVLKPGGRFYVVLYHRHSIFYMVTLGVWCQWVHGGRHKQTLQQRLREIEYNGLGEKPIVNVYSRDDVRSLLRSAGLATETITVRKLAIEDLPAVWYVHRFFKYIPRGLLDALGRIGGWYVCGESTKP